MSGLHPEGREFESLRTHQTIGSIVSKSEDTLNKAYGNAPKEVAGYFDLDIIPGYRGIKYYFHRLIRWFTR